jgi:hypothetical protein
MTTALPSSRCGISVTRMLPPKHFTDTLAVSSDCLGAPTTAPCCSHAAKTHARSAGIPTPQLSCASCLQAQTGISMYAGRHVSYCTVATPTSQCLLPLILLYLVACTDPLIEVCSFLPLLLYQHPIIWSSLACFTVFACPARLQLPQDTDVCTV